MKSAMRKSDKSISKTVSLLFKLQSLYELLAFQTTTRFKILSLIQRYPLKRHAAGLLLSTKSVSFKKLIIVQILGKLEHFEGKGFMLLASLHGGVKVNVIHLMLFLQNVMAQRRKKHVDDTFIKNSLIFDFKQTLKVKANYRCGYNQTIHCMQ